MTLTFLTWSVHAIFKIHTKYNYISKFSKLINLKNWNSSIFFINVKRLSQRENQRHQLGRILITHHRCNTNIKIYISKISQRYQTPPILTLTVFTRRIKLHRSVLCIIRYRRMTRMKTTILKRQA